MSSRRNTGQHAELHHSNMAYHFPYMTRFHRLKSDWFIAQTSKIILHIFNLSLPHFITLIWSSLSDQHINNKHGLEI